MSAASRTSPEQKRDDQGSRPFQFQRNNYHANSDDGALSVAVANRIGIALSGAADSTTAPKQQHSTAASAVLDRGAPPTLSTASCSAVPPREVAQMSGHHHPDLPFLVTHWLSQYAPPSANASLAKESKTHEEMAHGKMAAIRHDQSGEKEEALRKIHQAASNLASAFQTLEAFGHSIHVDTPMLSRPSTYSDLSRKYSPLLSTAFSSSHGSGGNGHALGSKDDGKEALLDALVNVGSSAQREVAKNELKCLMPWSFMEAAYEGSVPSGDLSNGKVRETTRTGSGRRVGKDLSADSETVIDSLVPAFDSAIKKPILLGSNAHDASAGCVDAKSIIATQASRQQLSLRIEAAHQRKQMECTMQTLQAVIKKDQVGRSGSHTAASGPLNQLEQAAVSSDSDLRRVVAQLNRRVHESHANLSRTRAEAIGAQKEAERSYKDLALIRKKYQDPYRLNCEGVSLHQILRTKSGQRNLGFGPDSHTPGKNNTTLASTLTRQYQGRCRSSTYSQTILSVLKSRLSHAATISCHLIYPVYCLKFDRTGRYFITGADDQVVKVFHLGAGCREISSAHEDDAGCGTKNRPTGFNYCANMRGAVLVCSLRGHAGVVTDIDVNGDNSLLATASGDGDVRVWGLKNGCPVAILRGHKGGANMVSWSTLTPFQLVTCGEDGLARMWDVSKAALKRYGDFINKRSYYLTPDQESDTTQVENDLEMEQEIRTQALLSNSFHPPSQGERREVDSNAVNDVAGIGFGENLNNGAFVANNQIDEGVTLVAQLQHGALVDENQTQERITRTSNKAVKVMCIARCPMGGHFATGSDDGLGRVWADDDDWHVERLDRELSDFDFEDGMAIHSQNSTFLRRKARLKPSCAPSEERLLTTLRGHSSTVTDMEYSSSGDRVLTASMKEGVVCVWSLGKEGGVASVGNLSSTTTSDPGPMYAKFTNVTQLCIQLTHESSGGPRAAPTSREKATPANCDGVNWTCDDMKIVTSQSSPAKTGSLGIIPGSQKLYVWDSHSGKCLMGVMSSHRSLCSALAVHPALPSVVASAGSDGVVNVWDLDRGDCFCTHTNTLMHGPAQPATDRGKPCGYLDVQFSPDGLNLVVTDENGRVTILDTLVPAKFRAGTDTAATKKYSMTTRVSSTPAWMGEQYFANDYYELVYDTNGYCIERGSELPPHLAPIGVRCTHEGTSHPEIIRGTYRQLEGPLPLPEISVRWHRDDIRIQSVELRSKGATVGGNAHRKAKKIVRSAELYQGRESTAIITKGGQLVQPEWRDPCLSNSNSRVSRIAGNRGSNNSTSTGRQLSSRYRWIGFGDEPETEDENEEQNDEDYEGTGRNLQESSSEDEALEVDTSLEIHEPQAIDESLESSMPRTHRRQQSVRGRGRLGGNGTRAIAAESHQERQPARASSRQTAQHAYQELNSDDEHLNEMMSTHTKPSGNFVEDWLVSEHLFKMPRGEGSTVHRKWLSRSNYQGEYLGRKFYCPQVGDLVVYIPRAHYDTMQKYPVRNNTMPWKSWPTHSSWPVVCCKVKHIRYRFPYKMYYRARCQADRVQGVSAILTLEISGVPSQSSTRNFPWPDPNFISLSNESIKFEVTVFECLEEDFIIPEYLYSWRIKELERAAVANNGNPDGISVTVYCPPGQDEDSDKVGYTGKLVRINERSEIELHFADSGYNALSMQWDTDEEIGDKKQLSIFCAWNISVNNPSYIIPAVPTMGEDVKKAVNSAIHAVTNMDPNVEELFSLLVDTSLYTDYLDMVEVPMYLFLIQKRLRSNYYTNKSSVVADMELVKENCYKYNEDGNEFYELACKMYEKFKCHVDAIQEPEVASFKEKSETHCTKNISQVISNDLETAQKQPPLCASPGAQKHHLSEDIPNHDRVEIGHDYLGTAEPRAQICNTERGGNLFTENCNIEDLNRVEQTQTTAHCFYNPSTEVQSEEKSAQRHIPEPSQRRQATKTGPSQRIRLRAKNKFSCAGHDTVEEKHAESIGEDESDEEDSIVEDMEESNESDSETSGDEDERHQEVESLSDFQSSRKSNIEVQAREHIARRQTRRRNPSYAEKDSEEEEYLESSSEEESDEGDSVSSVERVSQKRKGRHMNDVGPRKKRGHASNQKKSPRNYPDLPRWPEVTRRKIAEVGIAVLNKLRNSDHLNLFSRPVCECYPDMAEEYLRDVKTPMDFGTIEDERLDNYEHINELQKDLILAFRNCCTFNGETSEYYSYALGIWWSLNEIFDDVCAEKKISTSTKPRRR